MYSRKETESYKTATNTVKNESKINSKETFLGLESSMGYHGNFPLSFPYTPSYTPQPYIGMNPYQYPNVILPPHVIGCGG